MSRKLLFLSCLLSAFALNIRAQTPGKIQQTQQVLLPNGWKLSPAGNYLQLGDLPLNIQLSHSGKLLAVTNNGQSTQSIQLIDPINEKVLDEKIVGKAWYGLSFSNDDKTLYASGGNDNFILAFHISKNKIGSADTLVLGKPWPNPICPTGIAVNRSNTLLYTVTKEDSSLYVVDLRTKQVILKTKLAAEAYSCILSPDERTLYISIWGDEKVGFYNTSTKGLAYIKCGSHPNELLLNKKGTRLFVANANDNSVSIINTITRKVNETISTSLYPTQLTGLQQTDWPYQQMKVPYSLPMPIIIAWRFLM
jgi:YVTN family beta-propeller protein